jgi:hypothetical protein
MLPSRPRLTATESPSRSPARRATARGIRTPKLFPNLKTLPSFRVCIYFGVPRFMTLPSDLRIHSIRRKINATRPRDRAAINEDPSKKPLIQQRRERTCQLFSLQLHTPSESIPKSNEESITRLRLNFNYVPIHKRPLITATSLSSQAARFHGRAACNLSLFAFAWITSSVPMSIRSIDLHHIGIQSWCSDHQKTFG